MKKYIGVFLYAVLKNINLKFLLPQKFVAPIERLRTYSLVLQGAEIAKGSIIRHDCFIAYPQNLALKENVKLGPFAKIFNYSKVYIGENTEIGPSLHVQTNEHIWPDKTLPIGKQGGETAPVIIGKNSYLGANVTLLKGVKTGDRCIIAAGAVVSKSLKEDSCIYGGVPARKIKKID